MTNGQAAATLVSMGMADCSNHGVPAVGRCYTCHRPFCQQCKPRQGCCSERCSESRKRFADLSPVPRKEPLWPLILKVVIALAVVYAAWSHRAEIITWIEGKL